MEPKCAEFSVAGQSISTNKYIFQSCQQISSSCLVPLTKLIDRVKVDVDKTSLETYDDKIREHVLS